VLFLDHPRRDIRDTSSYKPFRSAFSGRTPSLKALTARMLGVQVQEGEHSSVQDAQAAVRLYTMFRRQWESELKKKKTKTMTQRTDKIQKKESKITAPLAVASNKGRVLNPAGRKMYVDSDEETD